MAFLRGHFLVEDIFDVVSADGVVNECFFDCVDDGYSAIFIF